MIRAYRESDLNELIEVWYRASLIAHPFLDESFLQVERKRIGEVYMPLAETRVYEQENRVVGFISLIGNEVGAIFVLPSHQGQGIGRALMDHARTLQNKLELDVFKANSIGRRFYDRYGFEFVREHRHPDTGYLLHRLRLRPE